MKKLFIAIPMIGALLFNFSCIIESDPETVTIVETVTVTDTLTITDTLAVTNTSKESVVLSVSPYQQEYYNNLNYYSVVTLIYKVTNIGDKKITLASTSFEATAMDGATFNGSGTIENIGINETISDTTFISVDQKECTKVEVKTVELTVE